jgi:hypothetical protein
MFVHLAPATAVDRIRRNGIRQSRRAKGDLPRGVWAVPVTRNFYVSHQWLRELRRGGANAFVGVYFRVGDDEPVWVGHYGQAHRETTAAGAVATFLGAEDRQGWEVVIARRVDAREIHRVRAVPQVLGWRFSPGAKGKPPFCTCDYCIRGLYGARKLRDRLGGQPN